MTAHRIVLADGADLAGFRQAVRLLIAQDVPPAAVSFGAAEGAGLFGSSLTGDAPTVALPRAIGAANVRAGRLHHKSSV